MGQKVSLYQGLSLRENVEFYAGLYGLTGARARARAGGRCASASLSATAEQRAARGPARRRPPARRPRARDAARPRLLFLDEPTAGVDVQSRGLFWEIIQEEADAGVTVFVTTHFLEEADYCDWVRFIDAGRLIAERHAGGAAQRVLRRLPDRDRRHGRRAPARARAARRRGPRARANRDGRCAARLPTFEPDLLGRLARAGAGSAERAHCNRAADDDRRVPPRARERGIAGSARRAVNRRRLRTLVRREVQATLRDPFTVTILIACRSARSCSSASCSPPRSSTSRSASTTRARSAASRRLVADLAASGTFAHRVRVARERSSTRSDRGPISVGVVIPAGLRRDRDTRGRARRRPAVQVLYDGAEAVLAGNAEAFVNSLLQASAPALGDQRAIPGARSSRAPSARAAGSAS